MEISGISPLKHRRLASALCNYTWGPVEKKGITGEGREWIINSAHASMFHWTYIDSP